MNKIFCWSKFIEESEVVFLTHDRVKHLSFERLCVTFSLYGLPFAVKVFKFDGKPRSEYESFVKETLENNPQKVLAIVRAIEEGLTNYANPTATSYLDEDLLKLAFEKGRNLQLEVKEALKRELDDMGDLLD